MNDLLPLRVVARRSGLTQDVLRAWERRYKAVAPVRTGTGRRMYSAQDVERLILLRRLTLAGHSIGQIAALPSSELRSMASVESRHDTAGLRAPTDNTEPNGPVTIDACLDAIRGCNQPALTELITRASLSNTPSWLVEEFLAPLMNRVGQLWHEGHLRISEEHLATTAIRSFVGNMLQSLAPAPDAPVIVVATPAGQQHEMGALFAAATGALAGWSPLYLGSNLPAQELAAAVSVSRARTIALSIVFPGDDPLLPAQLRTLRKLLPAGFPVCVGGQSAAAYVDLAPDLDVRLLNDFAELRRFLAELRRDTQR